MSSLCLPYFKVYGYFSHLYIGMLNFSLCKTKRTTRLNLPTIFTAMPPSKSKMLFISIDQTVVPYMEYGSAVLCAHGKNEIKHRKISNSPWGLLPTTTPDGAQANVTVNHGYLWCSHSNLLKSLPSPNIFPVGTKLLICRPAIHGRCHCLQRTFGFWLSHNSKSSGIFYSTSA